ncbi:tRNA pseudouridine(38/39) synthase [Episyrphus balteatus]|uniref:tRNA pseudouridine(38/39) synthase n=1 Tax=Episyrphus balteatus TaxID=286459 RepID=UPI002485217F|nr:tRNA pseudouridine(38/39) synthase [Episyrphus balteatus]
MEVSVKKRQKHLSRQELEGLNKAELIDKVIQLQAYNIQLKNLLQKKLDADAGDTVDPKDESVDRTNKRKFDFSKSSKRHVLLKFLYFGWDYNGLACQEDSNKTIEYHIFKSLVRTCLIESRETSNYNRCGRTDKEVSAFCQVISIDLRSKFPEDQHFTDETIKNEIDYCGLLNKVLPKNIQCIAWMPLRCKEYSARFDCKKRTYRYFFPIGDLKLQSMREGCELLTKSVDADFRNLCKMDVHNGVMNYKRKIYSATINECPNQNEKGSFKMCYLEIQANSFLWHQIRCIMSVLMLIGEGKEEPNVIEDLLDISSNPCKPQYTPAAAFPLNLYHCEFRKISEKNKVRTQNDHQLLIGEEEEPLENCDLSNWVYNKDNLLKLIETIQGGWTEQSVKSFMMRSVLSSLEDLLKQQYGDCNVTAQANILHECVRRKQYQQLMTRKRCESLENRVEHFVKKQRLVMKDS